MRWVLLFAVGCYHADGFAPCETLCSEAQPACPPGQSCGADGLCQSLTTSATCSQLAGDAATALDAGAPADANPDCFGEALPMFGPMCNLGGLLAGQTTLNGNLNTDTDGRCATLHDQKTGPKVCVIAATDLTIDQPLIVTGSHPLVLAAIHELKVNNTIDISSHSFGGAVTASQALLCTTPPTPDGAGGAGGGAGGSFVGPGGGGGGAGQGMNGATAGPAASPITFLRGGCQGSAGGGESSSNDAVGGPGGGAIYLIAHTRITINGSIYASGAAAPKPAFARSGGGGGGSGGMIAIEAPIVELQGGAQLRADGGGGGGGGSNDGKPIGDPKDGANSLATAYMAAGGSTGAAGCGGNGGDGSFKGAVGEPGFPANTSGCQSSGGGGGGGGPGMILISTQALMGIVGHDVSPPYRTP